MTRSPAVPFYRFFFGRRVPPTKIDYRKREKYGTLILTSLQDLDDLWGAKAEVANPFLLPPPWDGLVVQESFLASNLPLGGRQLPEGAGFVNSMAVPSF